MSVSQVSVRCSFSLSSFLHIRLLILVVPCSVYTVLCIWFCYGTQFSLLSHTLLIWWCRLCRTCGRRVFAPLPVTPSGRWGTRTCFPGAGQTPRRSPGSLPWRSWKASLCWQSHSHCRLWLRHCRHWPWPRSSHSQTGWTRSCPHSLKDS